MKRATYERIAFVASPIPEAQKARARLIKRYGNFSSAKADIVVALGGDGLMLQTLHKFMQSGKPIYGMHRGTIGFLMNEFQEKNLPERINTAARERLPAAIAEFDIGSIVRNKISEYPMVKLETLVLSVAQQHLKTIEMFGAVIGLFIGIFQALYFWYFSRAR